MQKKKIILIICIAVVIIGIFIYYTYDNSKIKTITMDNIVSTYKNNNYTVIYTGEINDDIKKLFKEWKQKYLLKAYKIDISDDDLNEYLSTYNLSVTATPVFIFYDNKSILGVIDNTVDKDSYEKYIRKYLYNEIPQDEISYKTTTVDQYIKKVNSDELTLAVIGEDSCSYCKLLLPVINEIAKNKNIDIYYFNKTTMSDSDYSTLTNINFTIPAKCTTTNEDTKMNRGFAKPMALITQNGELKDCILGYYDYDTYVSKLVDAGVLEG